MSSQAPLLGELINTREAFSTKLYRQLMGFQLYSWTLGIIFEKPGTKLFIQKVLNVVIHFETESRLHAFKKNLCELLGPTENGRKRIRLTNKAPR